MYESGADNGKFYSLNVPLKDGIDDQGLILAFCCMQNQITLCFIHSCRQFSFHRIFVSFLFKKIFPITDAMAFRSNSQYFIDFTGYIQLFKPIVEAVIERFRPTCIVLQVNRSFLGHLYH